MNLPNCHCQIIGTKLSLTNYWYQIAITKLLVTNCHYQIVTFVNLPNWHYQIIGTKLSLPRYWYQIVITKLLVLNCHYQIVTFLNFPNCWSQNVITKLSLLLTCQIVMTKFTTYSIWLFKHINNGRFEFKSKNFQRLPMLRQLIILSIVYNVYCRHHKNRFNDYSAEFRWIFYSQIFF